MLQRGCTHTWGTARDNCTVHVPDRELSNPAVIGTQTLNWSVGPLGPLQPSQAQTAAERSKTDEGKKWVGMISSSGIKGILNWGSESSHVSKIYFFCS